MLHTRATTHGRRGRLTSVGRADGGAVLLDVVIALALFVMAATVVVAGMSASVSATDRMKQRFTAENLAFSVMSEMAAGIRAVDSTDAPEPFDPPFEAFSWQILIQPMPSEQATSGLRNVEVLVTHDTEDIAYRLNQFLAIDGGAAGEGSLLERLEELDGGFD